MPRYYFHSRNGEDFPDLEGTELADDTAARTEAIVAAGGLISELGGNFWRGGEAWSMEVVSDAGSTVCELLFTARIGGEGN